MFTWLNKQGVESNTGFSLQRVDRFTYLYTEGDHILRIVVEPSLKVYDIFLDENPVWEEPFQQDTIDKTKRSLIKNNISSALDFMKNKHRIISS